jgi:trehalose/maltose hydrolase-like predicted phosphorylase
MSKHHKSSKRKDLAFITFNTVEEAKRVLDIKEGLLGPNVSISMAFSQQAMQTKKKIKENRKVTPVNPQVVIPTSPVNNIQTATMLTMMNLINMNKNNVDPNVMATMLTTCLESMMQQQTVGVNQPIPNRRVRKVVKKKRVNNNVNVNQPSHIPFINVNPLVNYPNTLENPTNPFVINPVNNTVNPNLKLNTFNNSAL